MRDQPLEKKPKKEYLLGYITQNQKIDYLVVLMAAAVLNKNIGTEKL